MNISLDFNIVKCDQGHTNSIYAKKCNVCGEVFDEISLENLHHEIRKEKLSDVFLCIEENQKKLKALYKSLREGDIELIDVEDQITFENEQINLIEVAIDAPIIKDLDLTHDAILKSEFINTVQDLVDFFNLVYSPIFNILKANKLCFPRKNTLNKLLSIARKAEKCYTLFLKSAIQSSLEDAKECQKQSQLYLDELAIDTNILHRIYTSYRIDNNIDLYSNGETNFSTLAAMVLFNDSKESISETTQLMERDVRHYFKGIITKDNLNTDEIIYLCTQMNSSLLVGEEQSFLKKTKATTNMLNIINHSQRCKLKGYIEEYKKIYVSMQKILLDIQCTSSFILGNNPKEKILVKSMIGWYKDLCEGVYRDSAVIVYLCCCIDKDSNYNEDIFSQVISFSDIESRFSSLQKKHKLNCLTEGISKTIRNAEAHVDYSIDWNNQEITFNNKKKNISETLKFSEFESMFEKLFETVMALNCGFHIFLINNNDYTEIFDDIMQLISKEVDATQMDIAPLQKGIVTTKKDTYYENEKLCLYISGTFINDDTNIIEDDLLSVFTTIAQFHPEFDFITLDVDNANLHLEMHTELLKKLDFSNENSVYLLGIIKYVFSKQYVDEKERKIRLHDMYYNIMWKHSNKLLKLNDYKAKCELYKPLPKEMIDFAKEMIGDSDYVLELFCDTAQIIDDLRLNNHCVEISTNIKKHLSDMIDIDILTTNNQNSFVGIKDEAFRIIDMVNMFKGEMDEKLFYRTKTSLGIEKYKNIGRNEQCPCGSLKKYKKCCGNNQ